jgi:thymidylate synthase
MLFYEREYYTHKETRSVSWPLYFAQNLSLGTPGSSVGLCLLWTPQERVVEALPRSAYAVAGNLYSREGISYLVRNVLACPTIRTLVVCGRDLTSSGAALIALMQHGINSQHTIINDTARLHAEIPAAAIEQFRRGVRVVDARDTIRPADVAALLAKVPHNEEPVMSQPLVFPYSEPAADSLPAEENGFVLRARTVRDGYLKLLWHVMTFGQRSGTQHSSDQRELLDVMTVVSREPGEPQSFSYADWMPFTRASLGQRDAAGSFSGYLGQFVQAGHTTEDVSYTYGDRLRAFAAGPAGDTLDQVAAMVAELRANGHSRRALATLWHPPHDSRSSSPPCLTQVQVRLRDQQPDTPNGLPRLHLTAYFRSHDIYRAWPSNAFGLRALQTLLLDQLGGHRVARPGELIIISASAHIYAHDWEGAHTLLAHHYRPTNPRMERDPRGSFVVRLEPPDILVQHYTPGGEHVQTLRGGTAQALEPQLTPYLSDFNHAIYLGRELQKAELALRLGQPERYRQDRDLQM